MKVSVIITAYNRRNYILNAIRSVADQTMSKNLYEAVVVKSFEDKYIDDYIRRLGFKNIVCNTPRYGERLAVGIEESSGDVLAFLEDDDEFKREKLSEVYKAFSQYRGISYFHDTRELIYHDRPVDIGNAEPSLKWFVEFLEKITPHYDAVLNPFDKKAADFLAIYHGVLAGVSSMSAKRECIENKLDLLKRIRIEVESFIPIIAAECGLLYHTGKRLTRYRIHDSNTSIGFTRRDQVRVFAYFMSSIEDTRLLLASTSSKNHVRETIKVGMLKAKLSLYFAPDDIKRLLGYREQVLEALKDTLELCRLERHTLKGCALDLMSVIYNGLPLKPISRQTLRKIVGRG